MNQLRPRATPQMSLKVSSIRLSIEIATKISRMLPVTPRAPLRVFWMNSWMLPRDGAAGFDRLLVPGEGRQQVLVRLAAAAGKRRGVGGSGWSVGRGGGRVGCRRRVGRFRRCVRLVGAERRRRGHARHELHDELVNLVFALLFEEGAGDAHGHRQHRDERQHRRVGQRRGAHRAAVPGEAPPHQDPEMQRTCASWRSRSATPAPARPAAPARPRGSSETWRPFSPC